MPTGAGTLRLDVGACVGGDCWLHVLGAVAPALADLAATLDRACVESPPAHMREGGLIAEGYDEQLDELRRLQRDTSSYLADYLKWPEAEGLPAEILDQAMVPLLSFCSQQV